MSQLEEMHEEESLNEDMGEFPIPRIAKISHPQPALSPKYEPTNSPFNPDLFQLFYSLVNFHLPDYDLGQNQQFSPALETVGTAFDQEENPPIMRDHIIRKFLLECHSQFLKLTSNPLVSKCAMLHNELFLASEFIRLHKTEKKLIEYCEMLLAEVYDLFNTTFSKIVNEQYWNKEKTAEDVINELLKNEISKIRILNNQSFLMLSNCALRRTLDKATAENAKKIQAWAKENQIS